MQHVRISDALRELTLDSETDIDEVADKYYVPEFIYYSSGKRKTRAQFLELARDARCGIAEGSISVLDEFRDGASYAERHRLEATGKDGTTVQVEVYGFGEYAPDGRFRTLHEAGFPVPS